MITLLMKSRVVLLTLLLLLRLGNTADTITANRFISDSKNEFLVSSNGNFKLGFFSPGKSPNRYLGIWFNKVSEPTIVWVANRDTPIKNNTGVFKLSENGNIAVFDTDNKSSLPVWSTNVSSITNSTAVLLASGNLVLTATNGSGHTGRVVVWQSFDYPVDTLLPGMKLGVDRRSGLNRVLNSWRSGDDPAPGDFSMGVDVRGSPQLFLYKNSAPIWRAGPWNGITLNGIPVVPGLVSFELEYFKQPGILNWSFIDHQDEVYYSISEPNTSSFQRLVLYPIGTVRRGIWRTDTNEWVLLVGSQDRCDEYSRCGASAICNTYNTMQCTCLPGFEPQSPQDWFIKCVEKKSQAYTCGKGDGEGFIKLAGVKIPDASVTELYKNVSLEQCEMECLNKCNCTGYASADVNPWGRGCFAWFGVLNDIKQYNRTEDGQDFYLRVDALELPANTGNNSKGSSGAKRTLVIIVLSVSLGLLLFISCSFYLWRKHMKRKGLKENQKSREMLLLDSISNYNDQNSPNPNNYQEQNAILELTSYDLDTIVAATDNFSVDRKLGEGGFGPVYKGQLSNGQDIAVKRLSRNSGQGVTEFKNEVLVIAKLQHRNLVMVLGCCVENEETILIYEYMPNKSLDYFIFDKTMKLSLSWKSRHEIIVGVARGILYLHQDSRLRIIHRDLKASNILLDNEMNPKISDFGTARIFGGNQSEANTNRVMGTYGYMSPEYALDGLFSVKSDVYSFGVIVLEVISGKKNRGFFSDDPDSNLINYAWKLWSEDRAIEMIDSSLGDSCPVPEILRCIQVGMLCVQDSATDRPTMSSVVFMLLNETNLASPKQPTFAIPRNHNKLASTFSGTGSSSINKATITMLDGR